MWWFCLKHLQVESGDGCANMSRLGPYASQELAQEALERMRERTVAQDELDDAWQDDD